MKLASIDIGSNTVLLLLAEIDSDKNIIAARNFYRMPRIGRGLAKGDKISEESIEKLFCVLSEYYEIIRNENIETTILTGTAALRNAANSQVIINSIRDKHNWNVKIVNGEEEARLSFLGATGDYPDDKNRLLIDIGGGSTEVIYGSGNEIIYSESITVGAVNLTEQVVTGYPVNDIEIDKINSTLYNKFNHLKVILPESPVTFAVAGTPTTISCINKGLKQYDEKIVEGTELAPVELQRVIEELKLLTPEQILEIYGEVVAGRNDVILTGAKILNYITDMLKLKKIRVSGKGIRYGAVVDYLQTN